MTAPTSHTGPGTGDLVGGKYRIVDLLGKGGMASVHRAVNVATGRKVAVKLMAVQTDEDPEVRTQMVARFQREARLAGTVETQHIVRVYDAGIDEPTGAPYMVMELLDGEDLNVLIRREGPLRPQLALRVTAQACLGLMKAHEAGVIHRDIKPSNVFLSRDEFGKIVVKVLDFGIAKASATDQLDPADSRTLTQTGAMLGSPHYMSPEQVVSSKTLDHRTDIWSMGVLLFKCLTGRTPHDHHDTVGQLIVSIVSEDPPSPQNYAPWVPPELAEIVHKALQTKAHNRYPTVAAMLADIQALLPERWEITPELLSPMSDRERGSVRPRRSARPGPEEAPTVGSGSRARAADLDGEPTRTQLSSTSPGRIKRSRLSSFMAGLAVVSVGSALMWRASSKSDVDPDTSATSNAGSSDVTNIPSSAANAPAPSAPTTSAVAVPLATSVSVAIVPPSAIVEVDGRPIVVTDGAVRLTGEPGSVHKLRVRSGSRESTTEVVITANGPRPSSITLAAPPPSTPNRPAASPRTERASPPALPAPSSSRPPRGNAELDKEFK